MGLVLAAAWLSGCVPMITDMWHVQPVTGRVFAAEGDTPVVGAQVVNMDNADITASTGATGEFAIESRVSTDFYIAMPASHMKHEYWVVRHQAYQDAVAGTATLAPPRWEQAREITVPMFDDIATEDAQGCRFAGYRIRVAEYWLAQEVVPEQALNSLVVLGELPCTDSPTQQRWQSLLERIVSAQPHAPQFPNP